MDNLIRTTIDYIKSLLRCNYSCSVSFSGGKDSSVVLVLFLRAIFEMLRDGEHVPKCYVTNSNTKREMPEMDFYMLGVLNDLRMYISANNLEEYIEIIEVFPSLSGSFIWTTIGRGKLPRYVNMSNDCSSDEKVKPQQKALRKIQRETSGNVIALIGSRTSESVNRNNSLKRYSMDEVTIVETDGVKTFAPIFLWEIEDVWELLLGVQSKNGKEPKFWRTFRSDFSDLFELYTDAAEGVCGLLVGPESKGNTGCGSRFGCAYCLKIGDTDKSLESLLNQDKAKYGYMSGLVDFRNWLLAIQYDMKRRDYRGRSISAAGYLKVYPDYFNSITKREMLRYLITLDALEAERARALEEDYYSGKIARTRENYERTGPLFQFITPSDILAIDFSWAISRDFPNEASPAAKDYLEIHELGVRYHIPKLPVAPKVSIPKPRWLDVRQPLEDVQGFKGLLPDGATISNNGLFGAKELELDVGAGFSYLSNVRDRYYQLQFVDSQEVCRAALQFGWLKMRRIELETYEQIARRNDYLQKLMASKPRTMLCEMTGDDKLMSTTEFLNEYSISDSEHAKLLEDLAIKEIEDDEQSDLFGTASIIQERKFTTERKKKVKKEKQVKTENIKIFKQAGNQMSMFTNL